MKLPFELDLQNKTVVVTGGAGVLGQYFAESLVRAKANVVILDLDDEKAKDLASSLSKYGNCIGLSGNVLSTESLENAKKTINKVYGSVDILINGAGGNHPKGTTSKEYFEVGDIEDESITSFFELDKDGSQFVFDLNFLGTLLPTQVFAKDMINKEGATIINVSSMNAFTPLTKIPMYSGAKAAISNFTMWLATHFSKVGIRVNAIAPGFFVTKQNYDLLFDKDGNQTARSKKILNATPMDRYGKPEELIGALYFLVSNEASSFVNGIVLPVDGGFSSYSGV